MTRTLSLVVLLACLAPAAHVFGEDRDLRQWNVPGQVVEPLPQELRPFVEAGTKPIWLARADLDRNGTEDFILVLEFEGGERTLQLLTRESNGSLRLAKHNDRVVHCSECGGMMGDPFKEIEAGPGTFTVRNEGGSRELWSVDYRFDYSRRDRTWQLVEVRSMVHDRIDPHVADQLTVQLPPKDYGKIDLADFDPENFEGKGER